MSLVPWSLSSPGCSTLTARAPDAKACKAWALLGSPTRLFCSHVFAIVVPPTVAMGVYLAHQLGRERSQALPVASSFAPGTVTPPATAVAVAAPASTPPAADVAPAPTSILPTAVKVPAAAGTLQTAVEAPAAGGPLPTAAEVLAHF